MDISRLTPEELQSLTPEQLRETFKLLTPDQQNAAVEHLDPAFRLTPDEQQRRDAAWNLADATTWRAIAAICIQHVVDSYGRGDIDMKDALAAMHRAAIGCWAQDRARLLGTTAVLALRKEPLKKARGQRSPKWPLWVQNATADLVLYGQVRSPELRRSPLPAYSETDIVTEPGDGTSPLIAWALDILTTIGWFGEAGVPKPTTVDDWVRARLRERAPPAESDPQF